MLERALAVIGPPAAGKTTVTMQLGRVPGCRVFRLREHVPDTMLAATATSAERLGWLDDLTVTRALRGYLETVIRAGQVHTVLLDNFPGSDTQARLLASLLRKLAPRCVVHVVELVIHPSVIDQRVRERRVCHQCERDPIHDPACPHDRIRVIPGAVRAATTFSTPGVVTRRGCWLRVWSGMHMPLLVSVQPSPRRASRFCHARPIGRQKQFRLNYPCYSQPGVHIYDNDRTAHA